MHLKSGQVGAIYATSLTFKKNDDFLNDCWSVPSCTLSFQILQYVEYIWRVVKLKMAQYRGSPVSTISISTIPDLARFENRVKKDDSSI